MPQTAQGPNVEVKLPPDLAKQAEIFLRLLHKNIRDMFHPHAAAHAPGGKDPVLLPLAAIIDVTYQGAALIEGDVLTVNEDGKWTNVPGNLGQAFFEATGSLTVGTIPGPTNLTGDDLTITTVLIQSDGEVAGTVTGGGAFSFSAGGGTASSTGLTYIWSDDAALSMVISSAGSDGTYLTADVVFTR